MRIDMSVDDVQKRMQAVNLGSQEAGRGERDHQNADSIAREMEAAFREACATALQASLAAAQERVQAIMNDNPVQALAWSTEKRLMEAQLITACEGKVPRRGRTTYNDSAEDRELPPVAPQGLAHNHVACSVNGKRESQEAEAALQSGNIAMCLRPSILQVEACQDTTGQSVKAVREQPDEMWRVPVTD
eukprot:TRINITY_DN18862_c0_g1_i2.p1 TRINITY_DN18862_c0_g1~~TRINITY_DN18862_c0_g1_i2.p1  ORF type:complete len:189 (+),score=36.37 TRINITY_DN18862_c0_g1_i2:118-684(+)